MRERPAVHVEFEHTGHHDHRLRAVPVLEHGVFESFGTVDEQATVEAVLVLDDPVATPVLADQEERGAWRIWITRATRRGRFAFAHDTSPLVCTCDMTFLNVRGGPYEFEE
jgi:hypothetical protein